MNEAINNFNDLIAGRKSITVQAKVPNSELIKIGLVMAAAFIVAFLFLAILQINK